MPRITQETFFAGEISPSTRGLVSTEQYRAGLRRAYNGYYTALGTFRKRWGWEYIGDLPESDEYKLVEWRTSGAFLLILFWWDEAAGRAKLRMWDTSFWTAPHTAGSGVPSPLAGWEEVELFGYRQGGVRRIQWAQTDDTLYFTSRVGPTMRIELDPREASGFRLYRVDEDPGLFRSPPIMRTFGPGFNMSYVVQGSTERLTSDIEYFISNDSEGQQAFLFDQGIFVVSGRESSTVLTGAPASNTGFLPGGKPDEGTTTGDWYGPFVRDEAITVWFTGTTNAPASGSRPLFSTEAAPASNKGNFSGYALKPGMLINCVYPSVGAWVMVTGVTYTTSTSGTFDFINYGEGPATGTPSNSQVLVPRSRVDGHDLFVMSGNSIYSANGYWVDGHREDSDDLGAWFSINDGHARMNTDPVTEDGRYGFDVIQMNSTTDRLPSSRLQLAGNKYDGYPAACAFHEGRFWVGGYGTRPSQLTSSRSGRFNNWEIGGDDDDSVLAAISSEEWNQIYWIRSASDLLVGTQYNEYAVVGSPITPSQIGIQRQSTYGSRFVRALDVGHAVMFTTFDGNKIRSMAYRENENKYIAEDVTRMVEHLFRGGDGAFDTIDAAKELHYMRDPRPLVLVLREGGTIACSTYDASTGQNAWSDWTDMHIETMVVQRRNSGEGDIVFGVSCGPSFPDERKPCLVVMRPSESVYLDHYTTWTPGEVTELNTGGEVNHLLGESVSYVDGEVYAADYQLTSSTFTVPTAPTGSVTLGQTIDCQIQPQSLEYADQRGTTQGRKRKISAYRLLLRDSFDAQVGGRELNPGAMPEDGEFRTAKPPLLTEWHTVPAVAGTIGVSDWPIITSFSPYQFEIQSVSAELTVGTE